MKRTKEWLVLNAVISWLYHYGDQEESIVLKHQYEELKKELEQEIINEQSNNTTSKKRGRPAKRQRTKKASINEASEKES